MIDTERQVTGDTYLVISCNENGGSWFVANVTRFR
jgi:hypothetical protein